MVWYAEVKCCARIAQASFLLHLDLLLSLLQLCKCGISLVSVFRQRLLISEFVHLRSFDTFKNKEIETQSIIDLRDDFLYRKKF